VCAVWADADTWFERQQQEMKRLNAEHLATVSAAEEAERKKLQEVREGETEADDAVDDPMAAAEAEALKAS
jgi:peptidyl-prolyl isomerase E (cyclophilin E)